MKRMGLAMIMMTGLSASAQAELVAHRAVYELTLSQSKGNRAPNAVRGMIAYDFSGSACEGYTTNFRQMLELGTDEGDVHVTDLRSSTFEDGDFRNFRFQVKSDNDGKPGETVDGAANRGSDGALSIRLKQPKSAHLGFPAGIVFPTEHIRDIIKAAEAGETTLSRKVFDGSDTGQKLYETLTVIGKKREMPDAGAPDASLKDVPRWPVAISYFEQGSDQDQPNYVLSFDLYQNGVSRDLKLDYGDFVLKGEMTKFEPLKAVACAK